METLPVHITLTTRVSSSAHAYLSRTSSQAAGTEEDESELLKSIRATLRGSRGTSSAFVNTVRYPYTEDLSIGRPPAGAEAGGEEELTWNTYNVVYSVGGIIRKKWSFEEEEGQPVQWACIGWLDQPSALTWSSALGPAHYTYDYHEQSTPAADSTSRPTFGPFARAQQEFKREQEPAIRARAVFIFLRNLVRVYLMNGTDYTSHLPFIVRRAWPLSPHGVMLQRILDPTELEEAKISGDSPLPTIFTFLNPFAEPAAVGITERLTGGFHQIPPSVKDVDPTKPMNSVPAEEHVVWVSQRTLDATDDIVVTIDVGKRQVSVWRYAFIRPKDVLTPAGQASQLPNPRPSTGSPGHRRATFGTAEQASRPPVPGEAANASNMRPTLTTPISMATTLGMGPASDLSTLR